MFFLFLFSFFCFGLFVFVSWMESVPYWLKQHERATTFEHVLILRILVDVALSRRKHRDSSIIILSLKIIEF